MKNFRAGRVLLLVGVLGLLGDACSAAPSPSAAIPTAEDVVVVATLSEMLGPWRPLPFAAPPDIVEAADRACRPGISELGPLDRVVVADVRGARTLQAWFAGPTGSASCDALIIGAAGTVTWTAGGSSQFGDYCQETSALDLRIFDRQRLDLTEVVGMTSTDVLIRSTVAGCAGAGLSSVWIESPQMQPVRATVDNGWFGAWTPGAWPADGEIVGRGPEGVELARVPLFR